MTTPTIPAGYVALYCLIGLSQKPSKHGLGFLTLERLLRAKGSEYDADHVILSIVKESALEYSASREAQPAAERLYWVDESETLSREDIGRAAYLKTQIGNV